MYAVGMFLEQKDTENIDRESTMNRQNKNVLIKRSIAAGFLFICGVVLLYRVGVVYETNPLPMDEKIQELFFSLRGSFFDPLVIGITHLGDPITIIALCIILLVLPWRKTFGVPVSLGALAGLAVYKPMKHMFLRARPDVTLHMVEQGGYSFPSGHSVTSVIVYGLLFYLIRRYCRDENLRNILSSVCLLLAIAIGPSRIYVGVHWPSDVLAGWCIGGIILLLVITVIEKLGEKNETIQ